MLKGIHPAISPDLLKTLAPGSWGTNDVVSISSTNQSDVLPGTERRVFTVPAGTHSRKFLHIRAESP
jgi:L-fucose mutarotase/ribose pyranase (RbsD/FucU family)